MSDARFLACTVFLLILTGATPGLAQQFTIPDYDTARDDFFWPHLYEDGGATIYCNHTFPTKAEFEAIGGARRSNAGENLSVEHAYPAGWIAEANGCPNRDDCDVPAYKFAEADLHNLWPALGRINSSRQDLEFGELPGETFRTKTDICPDYERSSGSGAIVEPQDSSKGNFARSIFYMAVFYDLPLMHEPKMLARWHDEDPPSDEEESRNDEIEELQGTRNPFIDYPAITGLIDIE